jgi:hypothetical protein
MLVDEHLPKDRSAAYRSVDRSLLKPSLQVAVEACLELNPVCCPSAGDVASARRA